MSDLTALFPNLPLRISISPVSGYLIKKDSDMMRLLARYFLPLPLKCFLLGASPISSFNFRSFRVNMRPSSATLF